MSYGELETPSVVCNYAQRISGLPGPDGKRRITRISHKDRCWLERVLRSINEGHKSFEIVRVQGSLHASLVAFARQEHQFKSAVGRRMWSPNLSAVFDCPDTPQGCLDALHHLCRAYPHTIVLVDEQSVIEQPFLDLYVERPHDSRVVIVEPSDN